MDPEQCNRCFELAGLHRRNVWQKFNRGLGATCQSNTEHDLQSFRIIERCFLLLCRTCWKFPWHVGTESIVGTNYDGSGKRRKRKPFLHLISFCCLRLFFLLLEIARNDASETFHIENFFDKISSKLRAIKHSFIIRVVFAGDKNVLKSKFSATSSAIFPQ